ncbi:unnamed protein product, partial [Meganyctiphanes norvegica]
MGAVVRHLDINIHQDAAAHCIFLGGETIIGSICLMFSTDTRNFADAKEACVLKGGRLATISQDPQAVIDYVLQYYGGQAIWVGASDIVTDGSWTWTNGQAVDNNFPWNNNEPNGRGNENCLATWGQGYNDYTCGSGLKYICELGNGNFIGTKNAVLTKLKKLPGSIMVNGSYFENGENLAGVMSRPSTLGGDMTSGRIDHMLSSAEGSTSMSEEGEEVEVKEVMEKKMEE